MTLKILGKCYVKYVDGFEIELNKKYNLHDDEIMRLRCKNMLKLTCSYKKLTSLLNFQFIIILIISFHFQILHFLFSKKLERMCNQFKKLPNSFPVLEYLDCGNNKLVTLPYLPAVKELYFYGNPLVSYRYVVIILPIHFLS